MKRVAWFLFPSSLRRSMTAMTAFKKVFVSVSLHIDNS